MGKNSTRIKNAWNAKTYDQVKLLVLKGQREQMRAYAAEKGMSLNAFINKLIADEMGDRLTIPNKEQEH